MTPKKIEFYVYEEADGQSAELERVLRDFVEWHRKQGTAVTASRISAAVSAFGKSPLVTSYLNTR